MSGSDFTYIYEIGRRKEAIFHIAARHTPTMTDVESFAILLFFELADGTRIEVAKVDDAEHERGDIHVDRYYREVGADHKDFDADISDHIEAEERMKERWRHFGRTYLQNHGYAPRRDGING